MPHTPRFAPVPRASLRHWALLLVLGVITGCSAAHSPAPQTGKDKDTRMQTPVTVDGYTYTDAPVEARLGEHRFRIPANYFNDQMGPDFQGGISLVLQAPDYGPLPPGHARTLPVDDQYSLAKGVVMDLRVPDGQFMKALLHSYSSDPLHRLSPVENIDHRTRVADVSGLEQWIITQADKTRYLQQVEGKGEIYSWPTEESIIKPWFIHRDPQGDPATVISCSESDLAPHHPSAESKERGYPWISMCRHHFLLPGLHAAMTVSYPRSMLVDWRRIEGAFRSIFVRYATAGATKTQGTTQ